MKIRFDVSSESSARQKIHIKLQALFSSKNKSKKIKASSAAFLFGALRVNFVYCNLLNNFLYKCYSDCILGYRLKKKLSTFFLIPFVSTIYVQKCVNKYN